MSTLQRVEFYASRTAQRDHLTVVTLAKAKSHLRVDHSDEDTLITGLIQTAVDTVEKMTGQLLGQTAATIYADAWASQAFTFGPVISISAVKYYDQANTLQDLPAANYWTDLQSSPQRITFNAPPAIYSNRHQGVQLTAVVGHSAIPAPLTTAVLLLVGHYYENRQQVITSGTPVTVPMAVETLVNPYRLFP